MVNKEDSVKLDYEELKFQNDYYSEYRKTVELNKNKSQDDFEKYINLWASGGVVISLMIISKIVEKELPVTSKMFFFLGLFSFLLTILCNLYSHNKSIKDSDFILESTQNYDDLFSNDFTDKLKKRNKKITLLNDVSIYSFVIGIISILVFVIINFLNMNNSDKSKISNPNQSQQHPKPLTEEKGRTNPSPTRVVVPSKKS